MHRPMITGSTRYSRLDVAIPPPDTLAPSSSCCRPTKLEAVMSVKATTMYTSAIHTNARKST